MKQPITKIFGRTKEERDRVRELLHLEHEPDQGDEAANQLELETDTSGFKLSLNILTQMANFINRFK